jgi:hypothetical protein
MVTYQQLLRQLPCLVQFLFLLVSSTSANTVELLVVQPEPQPLATTSPVVPSEATMNLTLSLIPFQVVTESSATTTAAHEVLAVLFAKYLKDNMFADSRAVSKVQKVKVLETSVDSNMYMGRIHLEATASLFRKSHLDIEQEYWLVDQRDVLQNFLSEELQDSSFLIQEIALLQESFVLDLIPFSVQVSNPVMQRPLTLTIAMYLEGNMYQDHNQNHINTTYQRELQTQQQPPPSNESVMVAVNLLASSSSSPTTNASSSSSVEFNYTGSVSVYLMPESSTTAASAASNEWISSVHQEQVYWLLTQSAALNDTIHQHLVDTSLVQIRVDGHEPNETTSTADDPVPTTSTNTSTPTTNGTDSNKNVSATPTTGNNASEPSNPNDSTPAAGQKEDTTRQDGNTTATTTTTMSSWESSRWMTITLVAVVIGSVSMALILIWARKKHARPAARRRGRRKTSGGES